MSNRANRAAQFNPFDTLKGLQEALREREDRFTRVEKKILGEESQLALSNALNKAEKGTTVEVTFYCKGHYVMISGTVMANNSAFQYIIVDETKIYYDDLYEVNMR